MELIHALCIASKSKVLETRTISPHTILFCEREFTLFTSGEEVSEVNRLHTNLESVYLLDDL